MEPDFDRVIDRRHTDSYKWDRTAEFFGRGGLLPMWVADMDFAAPPPVLEALRRRLDHGVLGYTARSDATVAAVCSWLGRRHGVEVDEEWLTFCPPGVIQAVNVLIQLLTSPGDGVVVQTPGYDALSGVVRGNGRTLIESPLRRQASRFAIDFDDLEAKLGADARMLLLCSPHNPTGRVWTREELARLTALCHERRVAVISDEIHSDIVWPGHRHVPLWSVSREAAAQSVSCFSINKTFNLGGLQTSTLVIPNPEIRARFNRAMATAQTRLDTVFGEIAVEACYSRCEEWLEHLLAYVGANVRFAVERIRKTLPHLGVEAPDGTYFLWIDMRRVDTGGMTPGAFLVSKAGLALCDGRDFGEAGAGFVRMNAACPRATLEDGLTRLEGAVRGA